MEVKKKRIDDAASSELLDQALAEIGLVEAAKLIIGRASPEDRAHIAGMALPEHEDMFQAIIRAREEFATRRKDFSKPPLPKLTAQQISAIKKRAKDLPWAARGDGSSDPFEWVRDNYKEWVGKGLLQAHLKADPSLYEAFAKAAKRLGLPEWLDVPNEKDAFLRSLVDPAKQFQAVASRHLHAATTKAARALAL